MKSFEEWLDGPLIDISPADVVDYITTGVPIEVTCSHCGCHMEKYDYVIEHYLELKADGLSDSEIEDAFCNVYCGGNPWCCP